eukprot:8824253-Pyramimonas_sp.AAC.1
MPTSHAAQNRPRPVGQGGLRLKWAAPAPDIDSDSCRNWTRTAVSIRAHVFRTHVDRAAHGKAQDSEYSCGGEP